MANTAIKITDTVTLKQKTFVSKAVNESAVFSKQKIKN